MTAAAMKPQLFGHLIASQPDRSDERSFAPTILAVLFHATLLGAAVWASAQLREVIVAKPAPDTNRVYYTPTRDDPPPVREQSNGGGGGAGPSFAPPKEIPIDIPAPTPGPTTPDFDVALPGNPGVLAQRSDSPGSGGGGEITRDGFRVATTLPALLNAPVVSRALERSYPPLLRDAGIGGRAVLWVLLNEDGSVARAEVKESSGQAALDDVALKIAPLMRFSPAMNRDQRVKVWVSMPIQFRTN